MQRHTFSKSFGVAADCHEQVVSWVYLQVRCQELCLQGMHKLQSGLSRTADTGACPQVQQAI